MTSIELVATIILSILVPVCGFGWLIIRMFKVHKKISDMKEEISDMKDEILGEVRGLNPRISHIEGFLIGFGQKTGKENK
jgi:hypothetical protein